MICPYCKEELDAALGVACATCATAVHSECVALHGGRCVTFGCSSRAFAPAVAQGRRRLEPAMPFTLTLRRGALAALALVAPPVEDAALAAIAGAGFAAVAFFS